MRLREEVAVINKEGYGTEKSNNEWGESVKQSMKIMV